MIFQNPSQDTYILKLYKRVKGNSAYEYDFTHPIIFRGRVASKLEAKAFRVTKGVGGTNIGTNIVSSNLPNVADIEDKVEFLGKIITIKNMGYFYEEEKFVNSGIFSTEYIQDRCPKGITIG